MDGKPYTDFVPKFEYLPNYGPNGQLSTVSVKLGGAEYDPTSKVNHQGRGDREAQISGLQLYASGEQVGADLAAKWESQDLGKKAGERDDRTSEDWRSQQGDRREISRNSSRQKKKALADALAEKVRRQQPVAVCPDDSRCDCSYQLQLSCSNRERRRFQSQVMGLFRGLLCACHSEFRKLVRSVCSCALSEKVKKRR